MKLENVGAIREFTIPDNWQERKTGAQIGVRWERVYTPVVAPNVELTVSYRGVPLDEASRKVFNFLLKQGETNDLPHDQILALRTVMGIATTGDNQYTNSHPIDSMDGPHFDLQSLSVKTVAGRLVLRVEGKFKNNRIYTGMFYQAGSEGKMVEEFYFWANNPEDFNAYRSAFDDSVNSIVWR